MSRPPGVDRDATEVSSGGDVAWLPFQHRKLYTNAFIVQNGKVLLGYKKRGFGLHRYNGFGGKVELGETPAQAALRELTEEAGITAPLEHAGTFLFLHEGGEWAFQIEIFRAETYTGNIVETEEMRPEWFGFPLPNTDGSIPEDKSTPSIPYDKMWEGDRLWLPFVLSKRPFVGRTDFVQRDSENYTLRKWWFGVEG